MKYSIVIPCYNEYENLDNLIETLNNFDKQYNVEFILVENGSKDDSRKKLEKIDGIYEKIKVVYVNTNQGYGYGIKQGLKKANGEYVGWIHADMQFDPYKLTDFFDFLNNNLDDKYLMKGKRTNRSFLENFFTWGMGITDSLIFKKHMHDVMSMPVILPREYVKDIENIPDDFSIDIYIYAKCLYNNLKIKHLPVKIVERKSGKSSWNTGIKSRIKQSKKMFDASKLVRKKLRKR